VRLLAGFAAIAAAVLAPMAGIAQIGDQPPPSPGREPPAPRQRLASPLRFREAAVVSESAIASRVGAEVLARGGNAVDAGIATAFALAVTLPSAGNIGGGGFLVVRLPDGVATSFDFRETAPQAARPEMFLGPGGAYDPERHHWSILSAGVPGSTIRTSMPSRP
jgi:gamma-glutamyltranspeptidase/glutathione hydrolase